MKALTAGFHRFTLGALLLAAPLALASDLGSSPTSTAACCQLTTTLANEAIRPLDLPGDERFFMTEGSPPNIHFLMDTSGSMKELPQIRGSDHDAFFKKGDTDPTNAAHTGCNNTDLLSVQASRGWNKDTVYEVPDKGTGEGSDKGHFDLFRDDRYYAYMHWQDSNAPVPDWATKEAACQAQYSRWSTTDATRYNNCLTCLQTRGFFKKPGVNDYLVDSRQGKDTGENFIFWGRFLNFNPPKYVTAKVVLKQVIKDLRRVRAGVSQFTWDNEKDLSKTQRGASMVRGQNPSCDQIIKDSSSFDSNRGSYINDINNWPFNTGTPLARSLLNVGYYFTSDDGVYRDVFGFGSGYSYPPGFRNGALTSQSRSVCWGCQVSSAIIITDGEPTGDAPSATVRAAIRARNGGPVYCPVAMYSSPLASASPASRTRAVP